MVCDLACDSHEDGWVSEVWWALCYICIGWVGICPDVIQTDDVKAHFGCADNRFATDDSECNGGCTVMFYSWRVTYLLIVCETMLLSWSQPITKAHQTEQQTQQQWIQQLSSNPGLWRFTTETPQEQEQRPEILQEQWRRRRHQETAEQREYRLTQRRQRRPQGQRNKGTEAWNIRGKIKACLLAYKEDVCILDTRISQVTWLVRIKKPMESTL